MVLNTIQPLLFLVPEVVAYFIAAIAGGIVSIKITSKKEIGYVLKDSLVLLAVSLIIVIIAGIIEVN